MEYLPGRAKVILISGVTIMMACLGACQRTDQQAANAEAGGRLKLLTIDEIRVGPSSNPSAITQQQTPQAPIIVALKVHGAGKPTRMQVTLFDLKNGAKVGDEGRILAANKPMTTLVRFNSASGWTPGRYLVEVKLNGKLAGQRDVDVVEAGAR